MFHWRTMKSQEREHVRLDNPLDDFLLWILGDDNIFSGDEDISLCQPDLKIFFGGCWVESENLSRVSINFSNEVLDIGVGSWSSSQV